MKRGSTQHTIGLSKLIQQPSSYQYGFERYCKIRSKPTTEFTWRTANMFAMACTAAWRLSTKRQLLHMLRMLKVACKSSLGTTHARPLQLHGRRQVHAAMYGLARSRQNSKHHGRRGRTAGRTTYHDYLPSSLAKTR